MKQTRRQTELRVAGFMLVVITLILTAGCSSNPKDRPTEVANIVGPDASIIYEDVKNLGKKMGLGTSIEDAIFGTHAYTYLSHHTKKGEPITCDDYGCWAGKTTIKGHMTYKWEWPFGAKRGVKRHEAMHTVLDAGVTLGLIEAYGGDPHPDYITVVRTGKRLKVRPIVDWRWPDRVNIWNEKDFGVWEDYRHLEVIAEEDPTSSK